MAKLIRTDGRETTVEPLEGDTFTKAQIQDYVGGLVESIPLADGQQMLVNEEGKIMGFDVNPAASKLAGAEIVGIVVVCGLEEFDC